jgi:hypothetical protein
MSKSKTEHRAHRIRAGEYDYRGHRIRRGANGTWRAIDHVGATVEYEATLRAIRAAVDARADAEQLADELADEQPIERVADDSELRAAAVAYAHAAADPDARRAAAYDDAVRTCTELADRVRAALQPAREAEGAAAVGRALRAMAADLAGRTEGARTVDQLVADALADDNAERLLANASRIDAELEGKRGKGKRRKGSDAQRRVTLISPDGHSTRTLYAFSAAALRNRLGRWEAEGWDELRFDGTVYSLAHAGGNDDIVRALMRGRAR